MPVRFSVLLLLASLLLTYFLVIAVLALAFRRFSWSSKRPILFASLLYGFLSGGLSALIWPFDSSVYPNLAGVWAADALYSWAAGQIGGADAGSGVPWILRIPQSYWWVSTVLSGVAGLAAQWTYGRVRRAQASSR